MSPRKADDAELLAARRLLARAERGALDEVLEIRAEASRLFDEVVADVDRMRASAEAERAEARSVAEEAQTVARSARDEADSARRELELERAALEAERARLHESPAPAADADPVVSSAPAPAALDEGSPEPPPPTPPSLPPETALLLEGAQAEMAALSQLLEDLHGRVSSMGPGPLEVTEATLAARAQELEAQRAHLASQLQAAQAAEAAASQHLAAAEAQARRLLELATDPDGAIEAEDDFVSGWYARRRRAGEGADG